TAYQIEAGQLKASVGVTHVWPQDIAEHVRLAAACCARTCASQQLKFEKRLRTFIPRDGELVSYLLNVCWLEPHLILLPFRSFAENRGAYAHSRAAFLHCDRKNLCTTH